MFSAPALIEALLIVTALSLDAFVSAFSYGTGRIRIPARSLLVINLICSGTLALALCTGSLLSGFLHVGVTQALSFLLLLSLGLIKVFDSGIKTLIRKHGKFQKKLHFSLFHISFLLKVYANPEEADRDHSRVLSAGEAAALALALSLDGLAVGFGSGLSHAGPVLIIVLSLLADTLAILLGCRFGAKLSSKLRFDFGWLGGALLIILAILKLP